MGFHEGELAVQRRAGVAAQAARLSGMLDPADLRGGMARFLAEGTFAAFTGRDRDGRLWISPLSGDPGFLQVASPTRLVLRAAPASGDPLHALTAGQDVGLVVIDFAARRRVRLNGTLAHAGETGLVIDVAQAYGNCPKYIQRRRLATSEHSAGGRPPRRGSRLAPDGIALIRRADTFFVGSSHPVHGADASHRGGLSGFVRVAGDGTLWWPDYPGNTMFNTLGNLTVDPHAALLFADFTTGMTVHLSGRARIEWTAAGAPGDDGHTGCRVALVPDAVVSGHQLAVREGAPLR